MANTKISALTADTAPTADDLVVTVNDPGGTPATRKATITNFTKAIPAVVGDSGSGGTKGLVPAPAAGDAAANKFLHADGTFKSPTGSGAIGGSSGSTDNALIRADGTGGATIQSSTITVDDVGAITVPEMAAPSTPAAGKVALYAKSDGLLYSKDDAGTETVVTGGGGGGGTPGGSDSHVQYNNGGAFGGDASLTWNDGTGRLTTAQFTATSGATFNTTLNVLGTTTLTTVNMQGDFRFKEDFGSQTEYWYKGTTGTGSAQFRAAANRGWHFSNTNDDATAASDTALFRHAARVVEINNGTAGQYGFLLLRGSTFANLPASPVAGTLATITDSNTATWGATIAGGGANNVLARYNGSAWTVVGV